MDTISEIVELLLGILEGMNVEDRLRPGEKKILAAAQKKLFLKVPVDTEKGD